jgi:hypothetical protein
MRANVSGKNTQTAAKPDAPAPTANTCAKSSLYPAQSIQPRALSIKGMLRHIQKAPPSPESQIPHPARQSLDMLADIL